MNSKYDKTIKAIKDRAKEVLPPGSRVILFGSRARGDAREDSDWDLHILVPGPERLSLSQTGDYAVPFLELGYEIQEDIEAIVNTYEGLKRKSFLPLYKNIEKDGILL